MNAINDLRHAENDLIRSIDAATAAVNAVGTTGLQAALDRYRKAVEDATHRMREAASVVANLATNAMFETLAQARRVESEFAPVEYKPQDHAVADPVAPSLPEAEQEEWEQIEKELEAAIPPISAAQAHEFARSHWEEADARADRKASIGAATEAHAEEQKPKKRKRGKASSNGFHS